MVLWYHITMISWFGDFLFHGCDIIDWYVWFHSHEINNDFKESWHHTWYHRCEYQYWYHDSSLMKSYLDFFFMSLCHGLISMHYILYDVMVLMSSYDVIGSVLDVNASCHAMKSTMKSCIWNAFLRARTGPILLLFSGGTRDSSSLQRREFSPNSPLLPFIPRLCPRCRVLVAIAQACIGAAAHFGSWAHYRVQVELLLGLVLKELLVSFAVHGVQRGQARLHRFPRTVPQVPWCRNGVIFTVDAIVVGLLANEHQNVLAWRSPAKLNKTVSFVEHLWMICFSTLH